MARLKSDGPDVVTPEDVWERVDQSKSADHFVLVIEDIDDEWCEALCTKYPKSINLKFLLEHILGIRLERREFPYGPDDVGLSESMAIDLERLDRAFPSLLDSTTEKFGRHIDCWLEPEPSGPSKRSARGYRVLPTPLGWTQVNRFLSYCGLKENFCKSVYLKLICSVTSSILTNRSRSHRSILPFSCESRPEALHGISAPQQSL